MHTMKPTNIEQDEMFPEGVSNTGLDIEESTGANILEMASERTVHSDFFNGFEDLFDDDDLE